MADLDDFFAKKDKKKKGGPKKFSKANTEVIAKNLEESAKKDEKARDKEVSELGNENNPNTPLNQQLAWQARQFKLKSMDETDDDEWDDYRENKKDYTGLKIENLTVEEPTKEEEEETEINEDGEVVKVKKDESGPWNKLGDSLEGEKEEIRAEESVVTATVGQGMTNVAGGKYVPPSMRASAGGGGGGANREELRRTAPRRLKAAPDINSEVYFPSLSSAAEDTAPKGAWGRKLVKEEGAFEEVKQSSQGQQMHRTAEAPKLALGNKFDALRDE